MSDVLDDFEIKVESEAGISLETLERWQGTRIRYRRRGVADKRWKSLILVDVHPFDSSTVNAALREVLK